MFRLGFCALSSHRSYLWPHLDDCSRLVYGRSEPEQGKLAERCRREGGSNITTPGTEERWMKRKPRRGADPFERDLELALNPGTFLTDRASSPLVNELEEAAAM